MWKIYLPLSLGFRNWKKSPQRFRDHNNSKIHRITTYKINSLDNPSIRAQLDSQLIQQQKIARKSLLKLFTSERYLLRQGMAFRGHSADDGNYQQLLKLRAEDDSNFSEYLNYTTNFTSPQAQQEVMELFSHSIITQITDQIRTNTFFAIMIDGTQDITG